MKKLNKVSDATKRECRKCGIVKSIKNFNKNPQQSYGYHIYCKQCRSLERKAYYYRMKELKKEVL